MAPIVLALQVALLLNAAVFAQHVSVPEQSTERVVLLHMHNNAPFFAQLGALTLRNKLRYAARHGYEVVAHTPRGTRGLFRSVHCSTSNAIRRDGGDEACFTHANDFEIDARAPTFGKIKLAIAACVARPDYWMLWTDADALMVNQSIALSSVIDDRFDMQLSADWLMINAGVLLIKCTTWTRNFLRRVYDAREFDNARALDQSAFAHFIDALPDRTARVGYVPKHLINVYVEEFRPGDLLLHMAGKLYEATTRGATAIAHQFDILSYIDDIKDVQAFFSTNYFLGKYSGVCTKKNTADSDCPPGDKMRLQLDEPIHAMSTPNRYRHVGIRYYWLNDWLDQYDTPNWQNNRRLFAPNGSRAAKCAAAFACDDPLATILDDHVRYHVLQNAAQHYLQLMENPQIDAPSLIHDEL